MSITNYLIRNVKKSPSKIAYCINDDKISNEELYDNIKIISFNLKQKGIKKGDTIAIISYNSILYPQVILVAAYLDLKIAPLNPSLSKQDMIKQLNNLNIKFLFSWNEYLKILNFKKLNINKNNCYDLNSNSKIFSNFTDLKKDNKRILELKIKEKVSRADFLFGLSSGSTSDPKIIIWSQYAKILRSKHAKKLYSLNSDDKIILSTPMYHSISFRLIFLPIYLNCTCIILDIFSPIKWVNNIFKYKITFSILVADQIEQISKFLNNKKIMSLRKLVSCCSPLSVKTKKKLVKTSKITTFDTYGASEVGTITNINLKSEHKKLSSNGKLTSGFKAKILNDSKFFSKPNIEGELCFKTDRVFTKYFHFSQTYKAVLKNNYFLTGDIGYFDQDGYLYLTGRKKDIIIRGGINIHPSDIEMILNKSPFIKESAVIGVQNNKLGEIIYAFIIFNDIKELNPRSLYKYCLDNLADYQIPSIFYSVSNLPRGSLNKISKFQIKKNLNKYASKKNIFFNNYSIF